MCQCSKRRAIIKQTATAVRKGQVAAVRPLAQQFTTSVRQDLSALRKRLGAAPLIRR